MFLAPKKLNISSSFYILFIFKKIKLTFYLRKCLNIFINFLIIDPEWVYNLIYLKYLIYLDTFIIYCWILIYMRCDWYDYDSWSLQKVLMQLNLVHSIASLQINMIIENIYRVRYLIDSRSSFYFLQIMYEIIDNFFIIQLAFFWTLFFFKLNMIYLNLDFLIRYGFNFILWPRKYIFSILTYLKVWIISWLR